MDVRGAVTLAKGYVAEIFSDEGLINLGLEEIERDEIQGAWKVTVGFSRPWNTVKNAMTMISGDTAARRTYRVVLINDSGKIVSIKRRENAESD